MGASPRITPEDLLGHLVREMADLPEQVHIRSYISEHTATFDIHVADSDVGKVLGKKGAHAKALRAIFNAIYGKYGKRLHLQVIDPRR